LSARGWNCGFFLTEFDLLSVFANPFQDRVAGNAFALGIEKAFDSFRDHLGGRAIWATGRPSMVMVKY
jgi:hypothetical protein